MAVINSFAGLFVRTSDHLLPDNAAKIALDVKLRNARLEAWREKAYLYPATPAAISIAHFDCLFFTFTTCVHSTTYLPDWGRKLYITGRLDNPPEVVTVSQDGVLSYQYLGVPNPSSPPRVSGASGSGRTVAARHYVYTYVNQWGEESAPSIPSNHIYVNDGTPVAVSGIALPPAGYGVVAANVFRSATGFRTGTEKEQTPSTDYVYVGTVTFPATTMTDNVLLENVGDVLNSREVKLPPAGLRQIRYINDMAVLYGVTNNKVHFSEAFRPYSWPEALEVTLPYNIVNTQVLDKTIFVTTTTYPFILNGEQAAEFRQCVPLNNLTTILPDIGCGYRSSSIITPFGMVYISADGLVLISPDGTYRILTSRWLSSDDWKLLAPETGRLAYWRGYIFFVTDKISYLLEINGDSYQDYELGALVQISDKPIDMYTTSNGELVFLEDATLYQWDAGATKREYVWESRDLSFGGQSSPTSAKIRTDGITFTIIGQHNSNYYERFVPDEQPFRLGRLGRQLKYRLRFTGTGTVESAAIGMTYLTINQGG